MASQGRRFQAPGYATQSPIECVAAVWPERSRQFSVFRYSGGHYRSDSRGVNLNRVWADPKPELHPSIYAAAALVQQLHAAGRLRLFVDCHAHSNKRGCFLYGNALPDQLQLVEAVTYAKLIEQNCRWFDFEGCTFSQASMSAKDPRDGAVGKEGSGRVGVYRRTAAWSK